MKELNLSIEEIKELVRLVSGSQLHSFELELGEFKLKMSCGEKQTVLQPQQAASASSATSVPEKKDVKSERGTLVTAPLVGTFYEASGPDKPPFVAVGQKVKKGDVLFIIESMKLMNEILCETDGTVTEILAENGQPVEFGQPILRVE